MPSLANLASLAFPVRVLCDTGGEVRTLAGQAGISGLIFLEAILLLLSGWRGLSAGLRLPVLVLFLAASLAQYALATFATLSAGSLLIVPVAGRFLAIGLAFLLAFGPRLPRPKLVGFGTAACAFLIFLTYIFRRESGEGFEWRRVIEEVSFAARYNRGRGPLYWFLGFFQDDFMRLFWWTLALFAAAGTFTVLAFTGPRDAPRPPPKQLPLYAPRRSARRKRR